MSRKCLIDEDFISGVATRIGIDRKLPFRIQKRLFVKEVGLPVDAQLNPFPVTNMEGIKLKFEEELKVLPFMVIVSEKPIYSLTTPLFVIGVSGHITYRDNLGVVKDVSKEEVFHLIECFSRLSWIEFARPLWEMGTLAGRLLYMDYEKLVLELQEGVDPNHISPSPEFPYYSGEFKNRAVVDIFKTTQSETLNDTVIKTVWRILLSLRSGLSELATISPLPTIEFAYTLQGRMIIVDVDWPRQWIRVKG